MAGREVRSSGKERNMEGRGLDEEEGCATPDGSESESEFDDSDGDPTFEAIEQTRSKLLRMSLRETRPRATKKIKSRSEEVRSELEVGEIPQLNDKEKKWTVEKMIKDGNLDKLKIDECKIYLRKYALRLTGNKDVLQARIKEHLEVMEGGGEKKYPISSFVLNCKGDACMGDVVMFEQNVYDMFSVVSRSATAPPCGTRTVAGRIVKESYGAAKQQHTFTIEVLWSKGEKPLPPLHPLLIKGRNLYRLKTKRQRWDDEEERKTVLQEKHRRGCVARCSRETRIREKEMKKMTRGRRHQFLISEKPISAGAQNTRHQALVSEKPLAAVGHGNDVRHQESEKCSDRTQCKQNSCSAQVMQPQASVTALPHFHPKHENGFSDKPLRNLHSPSRWGLPPTEKRNYQDQNAPIIHGNILHQNPEVNIYNALDQSMHHQNVCIRSEKPIGTGQNRSFHHTEPETHDSRRQVKLQNCSYPSSLGSPQHRYQLHASHRDGFPDRKPLRNLNSSSILGPPPHGNHVHPNHQDGLFHTRPWRNLNSPSRLGSQLHKHHPVQRQPCRLHLQGRCWYGDNCKYLH